MKKTILMTAVCAVGALTTNGASALGLAGTPGCSSLGLGAVSCSTSNMRNDVYYDSNCTAAAGCTYMTCSGTCACVKSCLDINPGLQGATCPDKCPSRDTYTEVGTGYVAICVGDDIAVCNYSCDAGYYGITINGTSGCTKCPNDPSSLLVSKEITSPRGSTSASDCYIPAGLSFSNGTGCGTYTSDCHYSE